MSELKSLCQCWLLGLWFGYLPDICGYKLFQLEGKCEKKEKILPSFSGDGVTQVGGDNVLYDVSVYCMIRFTLSESQY